MGLSVQLLSVGRNAPACPHTRGPARATLCPTRQPRRMPPAPPGAGKASSRSGTRPKAPGPAAEGGCTRDHQGPWQNATARADRGRAGAGQGTPPRRTIRPAPTSGHAEPDPASIARTGTVIRRGAKTAPLPLRGGAGGGAVPWAPPCLVAAPDPADRPHPNPSPEVEGLWVARHGTRTRRNPPHCPSSPVMPDLIRHPSGGRVMGHG